MKKATLPPKQRAVFRFVVAFGLVVVTVLYSVETINALFVGASSYYLVSDGIDLWRKEK